MKSQFNFKRGFKLFSSFWIWFAVTLLLNQIIFIVFVVSALQGSIGSSFASVIVAMSEAVKQIKNEEGRAGLLLYQDTISRLDNIQLVDKAPEHEDKLVYPGFTAVANTINEISDGRFVATFSDQTRPTITVSAIGDPLLNLSFQSVGSYHAPYILAIFLFGILIQCVLAAYWIATRITSPLQALSDQAKKLASGDELLSIEVQKTSSPEIKALSSTLNEMRSSLDGMISEREQILGSIAHDLRTPLSRLGVGLELIKHHNPTSVNSLMADIAEMGTFLDQFIELSKLNQEQDEPLVCGDLKTLATTMRDKYARAGVEIGLMVDTEPAMIRYKPIALTRLIYNLVDNAIRHGAGDIKMLVHVSDDHVLLSVENDLIEGKNKPTGLTQALQQTDEAFKQSDGHSSGLGLKIIRQFTRVHQAILSEESNETAQTYTIRFTRLIP